MAVIYIDVDDEITSVAARIRRLSDARVALVVPSGSRIATSRINFRLLAREASASARSLTIVASDAAARALAGAAGLEAHASIADYEAAEAARFPAGPAVAPAAGSTVAGRRAPGGAGPGQIGAPVGAAPAEGAPAADVGAARSKAGVATAASARAPVRRGPGRRRWPLAVAIVVIVVVLAASAALAYSTLPSAVVTIRPATEPLGPAELVVRADPAVTSIDVAGATIPATSVEVPVAVSDTFDATGKKKEETRSSGSVTFISKDPTRANGIPAGSIVRTAAGVAFATRSAVTIPKAQIEGYTIIPGTATVRVTAVKGGPEGNVAPNTISIVPAAEDPVLLGVRNQAATTGGTRTTTTIVTQKDVDAALKTLDKRLRARFADAASDPARAPDGTVLVPATARLGPASAAPEAATLVDQEVETFDLALTATGSVTAYAPAAARSVALARLAKDVPEGYRIVEGTATADVGEATAVETMADVPTSSSASMVRMIDETAVRDLIRGKSPVDAATALSAYGEVSVSVWPSFFPTVTTSDARIEIRIEPATETGPGAPTPRPTPPAEPSPSGP